MGARITAENLHDAADRIVELEDRTAEIGLPWEELERFMDESEWRDGDAAGPERYPDRISLAMGISIGVAALGDVLGERHVYDRRVD